MVSSEREEPWRAAYLRRMSTGSAAPPCAGRWNRMSIPPLGAVCIQMMS